VAKKEAARAAISQAKAARHGVVAAEKVLREAFARLDTDRAAYAEQESAVQDAIALERQELAAKEQAAREALAKLESARTSFVEKEQQGRETLAVAMQGLLASENATREALAQLDNARNAFAAREEAAVEAIAQEKAARRAHALTLAGQEGAAPATPELAIAV
jgi:hypothetical protein